MFRTSESLTVSSLKLESDSASELVTSRVGEIEESADNVIKVNAASIDAVGPSSPSVKVRIDERDVS